MDRVGQFTIFNHPAYMPSACPPPPKLGLQDGPALPGLGEMLFAPLDAIAKTHTGYLNLLCATSLPDTHDLNIPQCMRTLDEWTAIVRRETDRRMYKFGLSPSEFRNSEAYFRVLVMITILQRDLGVTYDPNCVNVRHIRNSKEAFLHGLLSGPKRGTCSNLPVLYATIGRALGYPIYLVAAKGHLFCRWKSARTGETFNIEASGKGLSVFPDDHYTKWPRAITPEEVYHGVYLRDFDPTEELGIFMAARGNCLRDKGHILDAIIAFSHAHRLAPTIPEHFSFLLGAINKEITMRDEKKLPCSYRQAEIFNREDCPKLAHYTIDDRYLDRIQV